MLAEQITTKNYAAASATATKRYNGKDVVVYRMDSSTAADATELTVRYFRSSPKRVRYTNVEASTAVDLALTRRKIVITGIRKITGSSIIIAQDAKVNITVEFNDYETDLTEAMIKDLVAFVTNIPLTAATWTKLHNEEV